MYIMQFRTITRSKHASEVKVTAEVMLCKASFSRSYFSLFVKFDLTKNNLIFFNFRLIKIKQKILQNTVQSF